MDLGATFPGSRTKVLYLMPVLPLMSLFMGGIFKHTVAALAAALTLTSPAWSEVVVAVHYLKKSVPPPPVLSNLDPIPEDLGMQGATLGLAENQTTGRFMGQTYALMVQEVPEDGDFAATAKTALANGGLVIVDKDKEADKLFFRFEDEKAKGDAKKPKPRKRGGGASSKEPEYVE